MAVPRVTLPQDDRVSLPQPLPPSEAALVRRILALQAAGKLTEAEKATGALTSGWLLGVILADRYLNPAAHPGAAELRDWLTRFGDQPQAPAVRALLHRLAPRAVTADAVPANSALPAGKAATLAVRARSLFVQNHDQRAVDAALPLLQGPAVAGRADGLFAGGLAAWRLGETAQAGTLFQAAYVTAAGDDVRAAAAYWAARAALRSGDRGERSVWLHRGAQETDTFYGKLSRRALGPTPVCLQGGTIGSADIDLLRATSQGRRAFALLQIGDKRLAEMELRALWLATRPDADYARALMLVAQGVGLSRLATEIRVDGSNSALPDQPPKLRPHGGFLVDRTLVYALVQNESNFQATATSAKGARGLMQIMPATAVDIGALRADQTERLYDPGVNLAVGQRYLLKLAEDDSIGGDLLRILAAYAQGPGGMKRWADTVRDDGDPLMFIEAIPDRSIAGYIKVSLLNAWYYAALLQVPSPSLDALEARTYPKLVRGHVRSAQADDGPMACAETTAALLYRK